MLSDPLLSRRRYPPRQRRARSKPSAAALGSSAPLSQPALRRLEDLARAWGRLPPRSNRLDAALSRLYAARCSIVAAGCGARGGWRGAGEDGCDDCDVWEVRAAFARSGSGGGLTDRGGRSRDLEIKS